MKHNDFEITGMVSFIDVKYSENGTCIVRTCISKKNPRAKSKEDEFFGLFIDLYGKSAEEYCEKIKKADTVCITGKVEQERFTTKAGEKVNRMILKGWDFVKAEYDEKIKDYVPVKDENGKLITNVNNAKPTANVKAEDETPWG